MEEEEEHEHEKSEVEIHAMESTEIDEAAMMMKSLRRVCYGRYGGSSISDAATRSCEAVEISLVLVTPFRSHSFYLNPNQQTSIDQKLSHFNQRMHPINHSKNLVSATKIIEISLDIQINP